MKTILLINILIIFSILSSSQTTQHISGTISDEQGNYLAGVQVKTENSNLWAISDSNGLYEIEVLPSDKILVFSFVGMKTKKIKINNRTTINVTLKQVVSELDEMVVVGYGSRKKTEPTGAVSTAFHKNMRIRGVASMVMPQVAWNTEGYSAIHENGFKNVLSAPLSTFSVDVDNAAYSNVRRYINRGQLPPKDAVRIEEMINYFNYDYPEPEGKYPFSVTSELSVCPWNTSHHLLHIGLKGKSIDKTDLPSSNLVFLLDVSGSMNAYNKLELVKKAFKLLVNQLRPNDRVAIVVYAGAAGKVLDSTHGNNKRQILDAIEKLNAGGSTAGGEGIKLAYKIAEENFIKGGNNRIILATDGDFNVGISSNADMERLVENKRDNGIFLTVLGFGMGNYKDDKMEIMADKGNGNYAYIDNIQEARKVFISEFGGTLFTIAKDVKFQLEFNPQKVKAYRLVGYENRLLNNEDFNDDTKDAGEMGAGHTVTALYEIIPAGSEETVPTIDLLKYQANKTSSGGKTNELLTIKLRYKDPDDQKSKLYEKPIKNKLINTSKTSTNFRFSAAVASFGMVLRNSEFRGNSEMDKIIEWATSAKGNDNEGYRSEFIQLVKMAKDLMPVAEND